MPIYATLDDLPDARCLQTWNAFNERLGSRAEMGWLNNNIIRHDITSLRKEDAPLLVCVKAADDWERQTIGPNPRYNCWYDFGVRLYFWVGQPDLTLDQYEAICDTLEKANEVLVDVIRSPGMICHKPYWDQLELIGGERTSRTSVIGREQERLYITTRFRLLRHKARG